MKKIILRLGFKTNLKLVKIAFGLKARKQNGNRSFVRYMDIEYKKNQFGPIELILST